MATPTTTCQTFRDLINANDGTIKGNALDVHFEDSYCNVRADSSVASGYCHPMSYAEMFNCMDNSSWAYTGIFICMGFSILGAGL
jgi:hypothetical protein